MLPCEDARDIGGVVNDRSLLTNVEYLPMKKNKRLTIIIYKKTLSKCQKSHENKRCYRL